ncbi:MAG: gluconate 2-dehydrogenase subunit 3 family protein [Acidobacteriota bacterium]
MAGQSIERREVLRIMALAAAASRFPGFDRWAFAHDHRPGATANPGGIAYKPIFFSAEEYATVVRLAELIIPNDGSPGAREAGVSEFIDFMVGSNPSIQFQFRYGLSWLNAHAARVYGSSFHDLGSEQQIELLRPLAYKDLYRSGQEEGRDFFRLIREYTVMGFYTSRVGLEQLDYPGLKFYAESPGCPHRGDPGHRHLPSPDR